MIRCITIAVILASLRAGAATWYLDNAATGANAGTNWANAWTNASSIAWGSINPGDSVRISGGTTQKIYTGEDISLGINGTNGAYVSFLNGQDAGHNGMVVLDGVTIEPNGNRPVWNRIDGARDPSFVPPANVDQVDNAALWTNNIGFWIRNIPGTNNADTSPNAWFFRNAKSLTMRWIGVSGLTNTGTFPFASIRGSVMKIDMGSETNNPATNNLFQYLYLHENMGEQFKIVDAVTNGWDSFVFDRCKIYQPGEDVFEVSSGTTVRNCSIGPAFPNGVHCDLGQFEGDFIKFYNNICYESLNALIRVQSNLNGLRHSVWIFNSRFTEKIGRALGGGTLTEPITFVHTDSGADKAINLVTFSNIVIGNNLWYKSISNLVVGVSNNPQLVLGPVTIFSKGRYVTNGQFLASVAANNLFVDKHRGVTFPLSTNVAGNYESGGLVFRGYLPMTTNDFLVDFNIHAAVDAYLETPRLLSYMDAVTNLEVHPFRFSSTTNYPAWVDKENENFELLPTDTAALNTGKNMSAYYDFDMLNRPRNVGGAWDRGPLEYQNTNLIVWLRMEDDFTDGILDDSSGYGNHGHRFGRPGSVYPTNFPTRVPASLSTGTNNAGYAAQLAWFTNEYGIYGRDGQYVAITNVSAFTNLSMMSVAVWARFWPWTSNAVCLEGDYRCDQQAGIISAGTSTGIPGTWELARRDFDTANKCRLQIMTNQSTFARHEVHYPDPGFPDQIDGDTLKWHHYGFTWSNGVVRTYYDGTNYTTHDISGVVTKLTVAWNNNVALSNAFVGVGCATHGGTPSLEDEPGGPDYPNHQWMNGLIDDLRIYREYVCTDQEIAAFALTTPPASPSSGSFTTPAPGRTRTKPQVLF